MTKLEQDIRERITYVGQDDDTLNEDAGMIASKVKQYIVKALSDAYNQGYFEIDKRMEYNEWANKWLKENGIE